MLGLLCLQRNNGIRDLACLDAHLYFRSPIEQLTGAAINKRYKHIVFQKINGTLQKHLVLYLR